MESHLNTPEDTAQAKCYFYKEARLLDLPLINIDYKVNIVNNIARILLKQKYGNPLTNNIEVHFAFPIDTDFCFNRLVAHF
jgi:hypothetical protein